MNCTYSGVGASVPLGVPEVLRGPFPVYQCHPVVRSLSHLAIQCSSGLLPFAHLGLLRFPPLQYLINKHVDSVSVFDAALPEKGNSDKDCFIAQSIHKYFSHPDITE
jgi:hypothetical protein